MTAAILGDPVRPGGCMGPVTWPSSAGACRMRSHSWSAATAAARSWPASSLRYRGSIRGACVGSLERSVMEPVLCGCGRMAAMVMPGASGLPSPSSTNGPGTKSSSMSGSSRLVAAHEAEGLGDIRGQHSAAADEVPQQLAPGLGVVQRLRAVDAHDDRQDQMVSEVAADFGYVGQHRDGERAQVIGRPDAEVVLSAGAINTPALLMCSGIGARLAHRAPVAVLDTDRAGSLK